MNRRLDVPIPETATGLYELSNRFASLSMELGRIARLTDDAPLAARSTLFLLGSWRSQLKDLQREWDTIILERERPDAETGEQSGNASGTARSTEQVDLPSLVVRAK